MNARLRSVEQQKYAIVTCMFVVQALDERGKRLNNVVETTSKLLQLAEMYADNAQK